MYTRGFLNIGKIESTIPVCIIPLCDPYNNFFSSLVEASKNQDPTELTYYIFTPHHCYTITLYFTNLKQFLFLFSS